MKRRRIIYSPESEQQLTAPNIQADATNTGQNTITVS